MYLDFPVFLFYLQSFPFFIFSKLHCIHFNSWNSNKDWTVDMLQDEDIEAVCLGQGWAACATSSLLLRVFTIGGVQKEIFSFPGPVVSMAGHGEQLLVVFHKGAFCILLFVVYLFKMLIIQISFRCPCMIREGMRLMDAQCFERPGISKKFDLRKSLILK